MRHDVVDRVLAEPPARGVEAHLVAREHELVPAVRTVFVVEDAADRFRHEVGPGVLRWAAVEKRLHDGPLAGDHLRDLRLECLGITNRAVRVGLAYGVELHPVPTDQLRVIALPAGEGDELIVRNARRRVGCTRRDVAVTGRREEGDREQDASHWEGR